MSDRKFKFDSDNYARLRGNDIHFVRNLFKLWGGRMTAQSKTFSIQFQHYSPKASATIYAVKGNLVPEQGIKDGVFTLFDDHRGLFRITDSRKTITDLHFTDPEAVVTFNQYAYLYFSKEALKSGTIWGRARDLFDALNGLKPDANIVKIDEKVFDALYEIRPLGPNPQMVSASPQAN